MIILLMIRYALSSGLITDMDGEGMVTAAQYSCCDECANADKDFLKCSCCISVAGTGPSMLLCGIPVGESAYYRHRYFEPKEEKDG